VFHSGKTSTFILHMSTLVGSCLQPCTTHAPSLGLFLLVRGVFALQTFNLP
jgi:hypothetical protein